MIDDQHPEDAGQDDVDGLDDVDGGPITRRQLLVGASVVGLSAAAAGALLERFATGDSGGKERSAGQGAAQGSTTFPQLGAPMPGDPRPDAPELARRGPFGVGVRGWTVTNPDQLDILRYSAGNPNQRYDRPLPLRVWYPAIIPARTAELTTYSDVLGYPGDVIWKGFPEWSAVGLEMHHLQP